MSRAGCNDALSLFLGVHKTKTTPPGEEGHIRASDWSSDVSEGVGVGEFYSCEDVKRLLSVRYYNSIIVLITSRKVQCLANVNGKLTVEEFETLVPRS